ncbi:MULTISPECIES: hypothetical protein [unclassified Campylobacter]|uniref:hypothetical protein n=1 Tax=unclassified Campylobacter TaxID=2593542 RepID=UPI0022E9C483|nr:MULTISPECIES: hypothetical protein [unclassified Campylobacter]MDA3062053.1 hypothetical protein [Campylobacter sp. JMF_14 EL1]MDA3072842.1 hypothetical protein [Campylobacter sp. JMF_10 EL2]
MTIILKGFEPIFGKVLFLGTCVGKTSMDYDFYYMDKRNKFWDLIDEICLTDNFFASKRDEYIKNSQNRNGIKKDIIDKLKEFGIGISDIIESCENTTNSSDGGIIPESIVYNKKLYDLVKKADIIVLNGKKRTNDEFKKAIKEKQINVDNKKVIPINSSSGANNRNKEKRKNEWRDISKYLKK